MVICGSDNMDIVNWGQKSKCIFAIRLAEKASSYLRESNVKTLIDAIAYVSRAAYEKEGINYLPEPINIVDDNVLVHMIQSFILCNDNECEYVEKLCSDIKKESMKS